MSLWADFLKAPNLIFKVGMVEFLPDIEVDILRNHYFITWCEALSSGKAIEQPKGWSGGGLGRLPELYSGNIVFCQINFRNFALIEKLNTI